MITNKKWTNAEQTSIEATFDGVTMFVPADPANRHYQLIQEDIANGGDLIANYVAPPAPVRTIHPAWLRLALIEIDKLDAVNAAVASQGATKVALWEYATTISENDPDVNAVATALSIDLAALFTRGFAIRDSKQV